MYKIFLYSIFFYFILLFLFSMKRTEGFSERLEKPWAVLQFDDRPLSTTFEKLQAQVKQYCSLHHYDHIFIKESEDIPPYWQKVHLAKTLLEKKQYKGVLWLDTDAVIHDMKKPIDSFLKEGKSFYYSPDSPKWSSNFNAGVWMVVDNPDGHMIMDEWMKEYKKASWKKHNGQWKSLGQWAGETYEQGSFSNKILPKHKDKLERLPWQVLQSDFPEENSFTLHFAGPDKDERIHKYYGLFRYKN